MDRLVQPDDVEEQPSFFLPPCPTGCPGCDRINKGVQERVDCRVTNAKGKQCCAICQAMKNQPAVIVALPDGHVIGLQREVTKEVKPDDEKDG